MQTNLLGEVYVPPEMKITPRQRLALACLQQGPVSSEALGAALHEYRRAEGGRGHAADSRCDYCRMEGSQMGGRLRELGFTRFSRKAGRWYLVEQGAPEPERTAQSADIPF